MISSGQPSIGKYLPTDRTADWLQTISCRHHSLQSLHSILHQKVLILQPSVLAHTVKFHTQLQHSCLTDMCRYHQVTTCVVPKMPQLMAKQPKFVNPYSSVVSTPDLLFLCQYLLVIRAVYNIQGVYENNTAQPHQYVSPRFAQYSATHREPYQFRAIRVDANCKTCSSP